MMNAILTGPGSGDAAAVGNTSPAWSEPGPLVVMLNAGLTSSGVNIWIYIFVKLNRERRDKYGYPILCWKPASNQLPSMEECHRLDYCC